MDGFQAFDGTKPSGNLLMPCAPPGLEWPVRDINANAFGGVRTPPSPGSAGSVPLEACSDSSVLADTTSPSVPHMETFSNLHMMTRPSYLDCPPIPSLDDVDVHLPASSWDDDDPVALEYQMPRILHGQWEHQLQLQAQQLRHQLHHDWMQHVFEDQFHQQLFGVRSVLPYEPEPSIVAPQEIMAGRLFDAISNHDIIAVDALLRSGADPNAFTSKGSNALFRAVSKAKKADLVKLLLHAGANATLADAGGNEVLHFWARGTTNNYSIALEIGKLLLQAGADCNAARLSDGMTPLHHIVVHFNGRRGWMDFHKASLLVRYGASVRAKTVDNKQPIHMIRPNKRPETQRLRELVNPESSCVMAVCNLPTCRFCSGPCARHWLDAAV